MNRRTALRNVMIVSAGAAFLPSCLQTDKASFPLKNISLTGSQERMLAMLTETIIPKTKNFIGANDLKAHEFLLTMVDDCFHPEDQQKFTEGMKAFDKLSHDKFGQLFTAHRRSRRRPLPRPAGSPPEDAPLGPERRIRGGACCLRSARPPVR